MSCCYAQCLQYKTDQQSDLRKLERLNNLFFVLTAKGEATQGMCVKRKWWQHACTAAMPGVCLASHGFARVALGGHRRSVDSHPLISVCHACGTLHAAEELMQAEAASGHSAQQQQQTQPASKKSRKKG
jgi:hypothetical protein